MRRATEIVKRSACAIGALAALASCLVEGCVTLRADEGRAEFYVDPSPDAAAGTFATITLALAAAGASTAPGPRLVHVAAGAYSRDTGEIFPLVLRGETTLEGAVAGGDRPLTILRGAGPAAVRRASTAPGVDPQVTLVVGERGARQAVRNVVLERGDAPSADGVEGIVCERGDVTRGTSSNVDLSVVTIAGFSIGLRVTAADDPAAGGCGVLLQRGLVQDVALGVLVEGKLHPDSVQNASIRIEDSTLRRAHAAGDRAWRGAAILIGDAVTGSRAFGNFFYDSDQAIVIAPTDQVRAAAAIAQAPEDGFSLERNNFGPLAIAGLRLVGAAAVGELRDNHFHGITAPDDDPSVTDQGVGLLIETAPAVDAYPSVRVARGNTFFGNDLGIHLRGAMTDPTLDPRSTHMTRHFDFGSIDSPGGNTFRCNARGPSRVPRAYGDGDVGIEVTGAPAGLRLQFMGNVWDHDPPLQGATLGAGVDLHSTGPTIDVGVASSSANPPCPPDRVPGEPR